MSLFLLPSWLILDIDKVRRNFLWSGQPSLPKKIHQVGWREVCKSPQEGGLGIKNQRSSNISLLIKWWWRLLFKPSPWSSAITSKYYQRRLPLDLNIKPSKTSQIWRSILKIGPIFKASLSWSLGNGKSITFWSDKWGPSLSLKLEFPYLFSCALEPLSRVAWNYNRHTQTWVPKFSLPLSHASSLEFTNLMQLLSSFSPSSSQDSPKCSWFSDLPSPKSSYNLLNLSGIVWKYFIIWSLPSPPRIKVFLWLTLKGKINTKDNLIRRGMQIIDPSCAFFPEPESIDHLFLNCPLICPLWNSFSLSLPSGLAPQALDDLWSSWCLSLPEQPRLLWDRRAPALMWVIWTEKNKRIFLNEFVDPRSLLLSAQEVASSWVPLSS